MVSLCSNCLKNNPPITELTDYGLQWRMSCGNEDPISRALKNLQMKIKFLESQRNAAAVTLNSVPINEIVLNSSNTESSINYKVTSPNKSNYKEIHSKENFTDFLYDFEKDLANEALKIAEEKCENLENQLLAMKRLFLRKLVNKEDNKLADEVTQIEKINLNNKSFFDSKEGEHFVKESNLLVNNNESVNNKNSTKKIANEKTEYPKKENETIKARQQLALNRNSNLNSSKETNYPFILGRSTTVSHNSVVKNQVNKKRKVQNSFLKNSEKFQNCSIIRLRSIYFSLCYEYDELFDQKIKIIDSLDNFKGTDLNSEKQKLVEITKMLNLKKEQIYTLKLMIKTTTANYKEGSNACSNPVWNK